MLVEMFPNGFIPWERYAMVISGNPLPFPEIRVQAAESRPGYPAIPVDQANE
jgi:hypothetical protein